MNGRQCGGLDVGRQRLRVAAETVGMEGAGGGGDGMEEPGRGREGSRAMVAEKEGTRAAMETEGSRAFCVSEKDA